MVVSRAKLLVGGGREDAERADAFGDQVVGRPEFVVLLLEHQVERLEHRPRDVPVKVVRL
jgi:hypothetical protein